MFIYEVKDLYIGILGYVTKSKYGGLSIERQDAVIIYKKVKCADSDYCAKEIFTNQKYYFFQGNTFKYDTIYKSINDLAIYASLPLSTVISKKYITKKELIELYNYYKTELNRDRNDEVKESGLSVTDSILQMILETSKKVKDAKIDESLQKQILEELENLSEYYVNEIINKLDNNGVVLTIDNEYTIKMQVIKKLVELEEIYQNPEQLKKYSLKKQLVQVKRDLK